MSKEFSRTQRIAELIQRELAKIILFEMEDPRFKLTSITAVQVAKDLSFAKVYVSQLDSEIKIDDTLKALNKAAPHIRYLLAQKIKMRIVPELRFVYDASISYGSKLSSIIDDAVASDERKHRDK